MRPMSLIRRLAIVALTLLVLAVFWVVWNRPAKADMAAYVPADSFAYLEANSLTAVLNGVQSTDAWRTLAPILRLSEGKSSSWTTNFVRWTGLGPTHLVVTSRAQVAIAVMNVGTIEEAGNLTVKPDLAIIIETHTSARRITPLAEQLLARLAKTTYGSPKYLRFQRNGAEFLIWSAPTEPRQIVAAIDDTVVFIGNKEETIDACLAVRRGARPSLASNLELQSMRSRLDSQNALAFGYVPSGNAPRLVSFAAPLLFGSSDAGFQQILPNAATKILGSIGWTGRSLQGSIEDRYLFSLTKPVVSQLQPAFNSVSRDNHLEGLLASNASATIYRFESPLAGWDAFESAMLSQLDAVSAVVFKALMKASLTTYGIEDAGQFLKLIGPQVLTMRVTSNSTRSTLLVNIPNEAARRSALEMSLGRNFVRANDMEVYSAAGRDHVVGIKGSYFLIGPEEDVRAALKILDIAGPSRRQLPNAFVDTAAVRSYSDDSVRVRSFFLAMLQAEGRLETDVNSQAEAAVSKFPLAITESSVSSEGIERRTRSPLGQFGTLATLLFSP